MDKRCTRESKCSYGGIRRAHPGQSVRQQLEDTAKEAEERGEKEKKREERTGRERGHRASIGCQASSSGHAQCAWALPSYGD